MNDFDQSLPSLEWQRRRGEYTARLRPWAEDRVRRAAHGIKHPVHDFLFEYYSFRPSYLLRWSPGVGVRLEGAVEKDLGWGRLFEPCDGGLILSGKRFPRHRLGAVDRAIGYLRVVRDRDPSFTCLGLHEWAMVYRTDSVRHSRVPLRLTAREISDVVEGQGLRCTHYDAFRFFTAAAAPRNRTQLNRSTAVDHDQSGCIHANMDLYRFMHLIAPFGAGEVLADAFEFAVAAREFDMRASPYDLRSYGLQPIEIETRSGRDEYVRNQRELSGRAAGLRERVLAEYERVLRAVGG